VDNVLDVVVVVTVSYKTTATPNTMTKRTPVHEVVVPTVPRPDSNNVGVGQRVVLETVVVGVSRGFVPELFLVLLVLVLVLECALCRYDDPDVRDGNLVGVLRVAVAIGKPTALRVDVGVALPSVPPASGR